MNDASYRPRRRIEQRHPTTGAIIGIFETDLSDAELAERDRAAAERRDAMMRANLSVFEAEQAAATAEREALAGINIDSDARDHLRTAHQALAQARDDLARRLEVAAAAGRHVNACQAAYDAARKEADELACQAAAAIVAALEQGEAPSATISATISSTTQAEAELRAALDAKNEVDALAATAEHVAANAEAHVKAAAREVIKLRVSDLSAEINQLSARLEGRRDRLNELLPTLVERRWPVPWPETAAALLRDPEADLDDGVSPETSAAA